MLENVLICPCAATHLPVLLTTSPTSIKELVINIFNKGYENNDINYCQVIDRLLRMVVFLYLSVYCYIIYLSVLSTYVSVN